MSHGVAFWVACAALAIAGGATAAGPSMTASVGLRYDHAVQAGGHGDLGYVMDAEIAARLFVFRPVSYCGGVDLSLGGGTGRFDYRVDLFAAGIGGVFSGGHVLRLCAGAGIAGTTDAAVVARRVPIEAGADVQAGPVRLAIAWTMAWAFGDGVRPQGTSIPGIDEFSARLTLGFGKAATYWPGSHAGWTVYLGASYREVLGARFAGAVVGLGVHGVE